MVLTLIGYMAQSHNIRLKKKFGQHFLRDQSVVDHMIDGVTLTNQTSVFEVGPGDGFLTRSILATNVARLWSFEIDSEWAELLRTQITDERFTLHEQNFLDTDFAPFEPHKPWVLLANLPYQVTFPILHVLQKNRHLISEGVIMVQEEVAHKITKTRGRGYGFPSLFFQHFFEWTMLDKIPPSAFYPPPKVFSRLLHFKTRVDVPAIPNEEKFWDFIKVCFKQPRRTMLNNFKQAHYEYDRVPKDLLAMRAQQLFLPDFLKIWDTLR